MCHKCQALAGLAAPQRGYSCKDASSRAADAPGGIIWNWRNGSPILRTRVSAIARLLPVTLKEGEAYLKSESSTELVYGIRGLFGGPVCFASFPRERGKRPTSWTRCYALSCLAVAVCFFVVGPLGRCGPEAFGLGLGLGLPPYRFASVQASLAKSRCLLIDQGRLTLHHCSGHCRLLVLFKLFSRWSVPAFHVV